MTATVDAMIQRAVERTYSESEGEPLPRGHLSQRRHFEDFNSGAVIENIVVSARQITIKQFLETRSEE